MRRLLSSVLVVIAISASLVACAPNSAAPAFTAIEVEVNSAEDVVVEPGEMSDAAVTQINGLSGFGDFVVGTPMEIHIEGSLPAEGAILTKSYAAPIPEEAAATFAFWDEEYEVWTAVPSDLSADRRTLTATVQHFSLWNDMVVGPQKAIGGFVDNVKEQGQKVADWAGQKVGEFGDALHWGLGNLFSTRVELPVCDTPTPDWVSAINVSFDVNDSVRFCVGHDANDPELLVVKARSNRGYGFPVNLAVDAQWESNSTSGDASLSSIIGLIGGLDKAVGETIGGLFNEGRYVGPGKEISFGLTPDAFQNLQNERFIDLPAPSDAQFTMSLLTTALVADEIDSWKGALAAAVATASCIHALDEITNVGQAGGAILKCLAAGSGPVVTVLGEALLKSGMTPEAAGQLAGKTVAKISLALAFFDAMLSSGDYMLDRLDVAGDRFLNISLNLPTATEVPGLPSVLQGEWCGEAPDDDECFAVSELAAKNPDLALRSTEPSTSVPGAVDYALCLQMDLGDSCTTASTIYLRYFPQGVGWDCSTMNGFNLSCTEPDFSDDHDTSRPRLVKLFNHQQDTVYHDSVPMYQS